jgi:FMN-dependent NADH-azoreductase
MFYPKSEDTAMRLLHVDSSARRSRSNSRALSAFFVNALAAHIADLVVDRLDVAADPPPHVTELFTAAMYTQADQRTIEMIEVLRISDALCDRLLAADAMVFGIPMYNYGMPSTLKALIDNIVRGGKTYLWDEHRHPVGQLGGKQILCITARGADLGPGSGREAADALTPSLRAIFSLLGATDLTFIDVQPLQFGADSARETALANAHEQLSKLADIWGRAP